MNYYPMRMVPCYKDYLWGGRTLREKYNKADAPVVCAESWELAGHPSGCSTVGNGAHAGRTLAYLCREDHDGFLGSCVLSKDIPIIVKLIDADSALSIQVHPSGDNAVAALGESGKTEMWYIIDCAPRSCIYLGLRNRLSRDEFLRKARAGVICRELNRVQVSPGDVYVVRPGTLHAIGAGMVVAEIQQSSDTTFRVFDYNRLDSQGRLRTLHLDRAAQVISCEPLLPEECMANNRTDFPGFSMTEMYFGSCFRAYRIDIRQSIDLMCDGSSFKHILCVRGEGVIEMGGELYPFRCGESYFIPAAAGGFRIRGNCRVLLSEV